jgi:murein DD-endopeptidase MepM/ murein hydrolase activator NlpD
MRRDVASLGLGVAGLVVVLSGSAAAGGGVADAAPVEPRVHQVKPGDTLVKLAERYGVTVMAIVAENTLPSARVVLRIGQSLVIPPATASSARHVAARQGDADASAPARPTSRSPSPRVPPHLELGVPDVDELGAAFVWPVEGPVSSPFGRRPSGWHAGIDIKAEPGTPVRAAAPGVVVMSGVEPRYGRVIKIAHDGGFVTVYAHNDRNLVQEGDRVAVGETIATVGRTGHATTDHVHFEIRCAGRTYNPLYLLPLPPRIARVEETDDTPSDE